MPQLSVSRTALAATASVVTLAFGMDGTNVALAQSSSGATAPSAPSSSNTVADVVITAKRLDDARATIQPQIGASTYRFSEEALLSIPGGDNEALNQVILQAPGVAQDSYGQLHIRGEHNGVQFRLDGVILPEGLSVFSQALSPRLADNVELITGALPAEYGLRTAGIIDIQTKSGYENGGSMSIYGGSHKEVEPSFEYGGRSGNTNYFVSVSYTQNDLGIEAPDRRVDPLHDKTSQLQGFAYVNHIVDANDRLSLILGSSNDRFQIPDVSGGLNGGLGLTINGQSNFPSTQLNESQRESTQYAVVSLLHTDGGFTGQVSIFSRYSQLKFSPDEVGEILYDGISQAAEKTDTAFGVQAEGAYIVDSAHTIRTGLILQLDRSTSATTSQVMLIDNNPSDTNYGDQISSAPYTIINDGASTAHTYSIYMQDEWKLLKSLTMNYGLRFDDFEGYRKESQFSPRINFVWKPLSGTTVHLGYARYFSPPPFELISSNSISKFTTPTGNPLITSSANPLAASSGAFVSTPGNPLVLADTTPYAERANYFDIGAEQKVDKHISLTIDGYYKVSTHLIDEGQFGAPIILTPFNYAKGQQYGIELTASYKAGPFSAYANFSHSVALGNNWITSQFSFSQAALDYVRSHYIYLDHDESYAVSAGASYLWQGTRFSADLIYGSGLRADLNLSSPVVYPDGAALTAIPNGLELPAYAQVNLGVTHHFKRVFGGPVDLRADVINLFDDVYQIRNGTGVGVFAPQYGPRRGFFAGLTRHF